MSGEYQDLDIPCSGKSEKLKLNNYILGFYHLLLLKPSINALDVGYTIFQVFITTTHNQVNSV